MLNKISMHKYRLELKYSEQGTRFALGRGGLDPQHTWPLAHQE